MVLGNLNIAETVNERRNVIQPIFDLSGEIQTEETGSGKLFAGIIIIGKQNSAFTERVDVFDFME